MDSAASDSAPRSAGEAAPAADGTASPPLIHVRMLLLGRAGAGKSQVFRALRFFVEQFHTVLGLPTQNTVQFCAPTGCAAALLRAQTVHSLLGVNVYLNQRTKTRVKGRKERIAAWSSSGLVVVDEVSMVPTPMHDVMGRVVAELRGDEDTMYADVSVCWCGDMRQFPPPNMLRHGGRWFDSDDVPASNDRRGTSFMVTRVRNILQSVNAVVVLDEGKRFRQEQWDGILRRLHTGPIQRSDINALIRRVLAQGCPLPTPTAVPGAPPTLHMLVAWSNHLVHRINNRMVAHAYARLVEAGRGDEFLSLRAVVTHKHKSKVRACIRMHLRALPNICTLQQTVELDTATLQHLASSFTLDKRNFAHFFLPLFPHCPAQSSKTWRQSWARQKALLQLLSE